MHSRHITITTLALALAASAPAIAKKKTEKAEPAAKEAKAEKVEKATAEITAPSDDLWFEAPIVAAPVATEKASKKSKAKKAKKAKKEPSYGLTLGLHNARNVRQAPRVEERAEDMSLKLHQSDIRRVIRDQRRAISFCGRRAAKRGERQPQVVLHFRVDSKGSVDRVKVTEVSGKKLPAMSTCMRRAAKSWQLPADTAGGEIEYPLMLNRR